ncbi:MAG: 2-C-methyl-D-erythritol 2,4-cyclodiphosphate synthase [Dehalococcoidia bacterium]|nr:2-C-methyl-D-erythritol 2,4-cyclodiphosphate synthase [Dehalococcoidia bacterium]
MGPSREPAIVSQQRAGIGYDAHPLVPGRPLILGGVAIPHDHGLGGHSDSDVAAHAIAEALLGAAALGDLGAHFPPSDPQWKDVSSMLFLERIAALLEGSGWRIASVDATIIAQKPMLSPYIPQMRQAIAAALKVDASQVSVKGKSTNGLGFEGRGEGIAAHAIALLERGPA